MTVTTFWNVLFESDSFEKEVSLEKVRDSASISGAIERAARVDRAAVWRALSSSLSVRAKGLLSEPIEKRILGAFAAYRDLLPYADPKRYPPEKEIVKAYAKKSLEVGIEPKLELSVDGKVIETLT